MSRNMRTGEYFLNDTECEDVVMRAARAGLEYCMSSDLHHLVHGYSGGADSLAVGLIEEVMCDMAAKIGYELHQIGLLMPCQSSADSLRLGRLAAETTGAHIIEVDLTKVLHFFDCTVMSGLDHRIQEILTQTNGQAALDSWEWTGLLGQGNNKARLRMIVAYYVAGRVKGMVMSTDNLSEYWLAFWTKHGDVGDFGLIQMVMKGLELYDILRWFNKRKDGRLIEIVQAKPDDGLGIGNGDADQIGATYDVVDRIMITQIRRGLDIDGPLSQLNNLVQVEGIPMEVVHKVVRRCLLGFHKRADCLVLTREQLGLPPIESIDLMPSCGPCGTMGTEVLDRS